MHLISGCRWLPQRRLWRNLPHLHADWSDQARGDGDNRKRSSHGKLTSWEKETIKRESQQASKGSCSPTPLVTRVKLKPRESSALFCLALWRTFVMSAVDVSARDHHGHWNESVMNNRHDSVSRECLFTSELMSRQSRRTCVWTAKCWGEGREKCERRLWECGGRPASKEERRFERRRVGGGHNNCITWTK